MARRLGERTQAVVFVILLALSITGLYAYIQLSQPPPVAASGLIRASLLIDGGAWTIAYGPKETLNNTAYSILMEASSRLGFPVQATRWSIPDAMFVTSINGTTNGQEGHYWQYWVNGVYGATAADHAALKDGDAVLWRFTTDQGGGA